VGEVLHSPNTEWAAEHNLYFFVSLLCLIATTASVKCLDYNLVMANVRGSRAKASRNRIREFALSHDVATNEDNMPKHLPLSTYHN